MKRVCVCVYSSWSTKMDATISMLYISQEQFSSHFTILALYKFAIYGILWALLYVN